MRRVENQRQSGQISQRGSGLVGLGLLDRRYGAANIARVLHGTTSRRPHCPGQSSDAARSSLCIRSGQAGRVLIARDNDKLQIGFAYDKQIEIAGPVFLLIKYQGHSH